MANPYRAANYIGEFASDAACLAVIQTRAWDSNGDGTGAPQNGMWFYDTVLHVHRAYVNGAWSSLSNSPVAGFTPEGGLAVYLINKTGAPSVKGMVVEAGAAVDGSFVSTGAAEFMPIGVVYDAGIADGSLCRVVIYGVAQVLLEDTTASTAGNWVKTSNGAAGRADATLAGPPGGGVVQLDEHSREIGHCLESKAAGVSVLALCVLHFN